jgi:hypothetical protein
MHALPALVQTKYALLLHAFPTLLATGTRTSRIPSMTWTRTRLRRCLPPSDFRRRPPTPVRSRACGGFSPFGCASLPESRRQNQNTRLRAHGRRRHSTSTLRALARTIMRVLAVRPGHYTSRVLLSQRRDALSATSCLVGPAISRPHDAMISRSRPHDLMTFEFLSSLPLPQRLIYELLPYAPPQLLHAIHVLCYVYICVKLCYDLCRVHQQTSRIQCRLSSCIMPEIKHDPDHRVREHRRLVQLLPQGALLSHVGGVEVGRELGKLGRRLLFRLLVCGWAAIWC